jgi:hypothetical protein
MEDDNKIPENQNNNRFEITELYMFMADIKRTYIGTIKRHNDYEGKEIAISGQVMVNCYILLSRAASIEILSNYLDDTIKLILDFGLTSIQGITSKLAGSTFNYN